MPGNGPDGDADGGRSGRHGVKATLPWRPGVVLAAVTGVLTGLAVGAFDRVTRTLIFDHLAHLPHAARALTPLAGLVLAAATLRWLGRGCSPATADEYIRDIHAPGPLPLAPVPARVLASVATLGLGGAMGYEGPSIYMGAAIGSTLSRRCRRWLVGEEPKLLLVAGAAAGVAAIFKAPATGLVFALEVPYRDGFARRMLVPAGVSAAVSYLVFVALTNTTPVFSVAGAPPFDFRDLGGAVLLGVACGIAARGYVALLGAAKEVAARANPWLRSVAAGLALAGVAWIAFAVLSQGLTLGAGYDNLTWALDPHRGLDLVAALLLLRAAATALTVGGGGAGGLFIPLVVEGALLGRLVGGFVHTPAGAATFFPVVGVSALLGAGYGVPLAGVVFAAEATGRPGFVVPGLLATVVAALCMGDHTLSAYQRPPPR